VQYCCIECIGTALTLSVEEYLMSASTSPTATPPQGAAVRFPFPPALYIGPLAVALAVQYWLLPLSLPGGSPVTLVGVVLTVGGLIFSLSGTATVLRHRTTVVPHRPVSALVTTGPFRISRNPMYTGHVISLIGAGLWAGSWWPIIVAPLCMLATYRLVIDAEEDYLTRLFGAEYGRYRARVRRWL
jgi:protein-S-isoprenylcysteine O-methyltransferase Ste14